MLRLSYASTKNRDIFYMIRMEIPDEFFMLETSGKILVFLDHREFGVFKEKNTNQKIEVILLNDLLAEAEKKQLQTALELYFTDQNGYPAGNALNLGSGNAACLNASGWEAAGCASPYMGVVPTDPLTAQKYAYTAANNSYAITATLEGLSNGFTDGITLSPNGIAD